MIGDEFKMERPMIRGFDARRRPMSNFQDAVMIDSEPIRLTKLAKRAGCAAKQPPGFLLPLLGDAAADHRPERPRRQRHRRRRGRLPALRRPGPGADHRLLHPDRGSALRLRRGSPPPTP